MDRSETLLDAISTVWKWRKAIIWFTISAFVISCIVTFSLPNYYKASTIFYAASPDLAKPAAIGRTSEDVEYYGLDTDLDRLFSIANSQLVTDHLIVRFDLYDHYKIKRDQAKAKYKINKKFGKLYNTLKTKYDALELSVEDQDPEVAAKMANDAREQINKIAQALIKESQKKMIEAQKNSLKEKELELKILNDSLANIREQYGIYDLISQGEVLVEQRTNSQAKLNETKAKLQVLEERAIMPDSIAYLEAKVAGYSAQFRQIQDDIKSYNQGYNTIHALDKERLELSSQLSLDKERQKQLQAAYQSDFSSLHVVEAATVPVHKSRPMRSLYVLISTMFAFVICSLAALAIETVRSIEWKDILKS